MYVFILKTYLKSTPIRGVSCSCFTHVTYLKSVLAADISCWGFTLKTHINRALIACVGPTSSYITNDDENVKDKICKDDFVDHTIDFDRPYVEDY